MHQINFVTGNREKFSIAEAVCREFGITLTQSKHDIDEIQAEHAEPIVLDKVTRAYAACDAPVVVNDDYWALPALGGFPGPYMKSVAYWFTPADFLRLMQNIEDRSIILTQSIAYQDEVVQKVFTRHYAGQIVLEPRGSYGNSLQKVITMPGDNGLTVSQCYDNGTRHDQREVGEGWKEFAAWYRKEVAK